MAASNVVYRRLPAKNNLVSNGAGGLRVASCAFVDKNGVSVDDGDLCTMDESAKRDTSSGVMELSKDALVREKLSLTPAPISGNPAHCEIGSPGDKQAKRLARDSIVRVAPPGFTVDATGKVLTAVPAAAQAVSGTPAAPVTSPPGTPTP